MTDPKPKLPPLSPEQRRWLERIASEPGRIFEARSQLISSLRRKGYVTTIPAERPAGILRAVIAATITTEGAARLALKKNRA